MRIVSGEPQTRRARRLHVVDVMPDAASPVVSAPWHVRLFGRMLEVLLRRRVPLGFNRLVTIRGRRSGQPHTTPLAVIEQGDRRWVWSPWGEVNWVRNLRAARRATLDDHGRIEDVGAIELDRDERVRFFRDVLRPLARGIPFGVLFIRVADGVDVNKPFEVAEDRRVFELLRTASQTEEP